MENPMLLAFLFLLAGVVAVPVATRLGLGSVLGYLIAGIAISPLLLQLGVDIVSIQHYAEFGVVMMLFLVGLELEPQVLWRMKSRLLGLGGLQVLLTILAVMGIAATLDQPLRVGLAIGMVFAMSSTAIVLQTLSEKGLMKSDGGQAGFSVLLFQDIAVIPMLAVVPLLTLPELQALAGQAGAAHSDGMIAHLPGWQRALVTVTAIAAVIAGGSYLTRPIFRFIAMARLRELFTAVALMIVIGIALLMMLVGLSPALGTFLAGVVLANSEYRHELESNIEPFKGLLLGLFFITVGAAIDFGLLSENLALIVGMTLGLLALKAAVLFAIGTLFGIRGSDRWLLSLGLAQAGEFGFVLLAFMVANAAIPQALSQILLLVVAMSMLLTPALFIFHSKFIVPAHAKSQARAADEVDEQADIIIAGHGRFGGIINRILLAAGYRTVVLDHHAENLDRLRIFGFKVFYGDATRPELLHAAGIDHARLLIVAIDNREQSLELVRYVSKNFPQVYVVARAIDRGHVYELWGAGARDIIRETFDSAVRAGRSALEALGLHPFDAERQVRQFMVGDKASIRELAELYNPDIPVHENAAYVARSKELMARQDAEMKAQGHRRIGQSDHRWEPPTPDDVEAMTRENTQE